MTSPRAWATAILGIHAYLRRYRGDRNARLIELELADRLLELYARTSQPAWQWFEDVLSYDNAALPQALLAAGLDLERAELTDAGLSALSWLIHVQLGGGSHFVPIGSNGFYPRGGARARFDPRSRRASIAADGVVRDGSSAVNEAMISGESRPVDKKPGDKVIAGTVNATGSLRVEVTGTGEQTALGSHLGHSLHVAPRPRESKRRGRVDIGVSHGLGGNATRRTRD